MIDISLPRLLDDELRTARWIRPIKVSVNLEITPLSYASMELMQEESVPARAFVELFTSMGSAGIYRVTSPQNAYGDDIITCELEHAITEVGDWLVTDEYEENTAADSAMRTVFGYYRGHSWQLGDVSALGSDDIALDCDHDNVLEVMLNILSQKTDCMMAFDFNTRPWTVSIVKKDTEVTAEGRLSRNVNRAKVTYDDSSLCTRGYYQYTETDEDGNSETIWAYMDADTMSTYGRVERHVTTGSSYTQSEAETAVSVYMEKHKRPLVSVSIEAEELSSITGETLDTFTIGKKFRLALPDYNTELEDVITGLEWQDVYGAPESVTVKLGDTEDTVISFLHDLDSSGGSSSGGRSGRSSSKKDADNYTNILKNNYAIRLEAYERVAADDWNYSFIELTASYIRSEVGETANGLYSRIEQTARYIRAEVHDVSNGLYSRIEMTASYIRSEVANTANGLYSRIEQTASKIRSEVANTKEGLESSITQTASQIRAEVKSTKEGLESSITQTASQIRSEVKSTKEGLESSITQTASTIRSEVKSTKEGLESSIKQNADSIETKVSKDGVISSINQTSESVTINASKINLNGYVTASQLNAVSAKIDSIASISGSTIELSCTRLNGNAVQWKALTLTDGDGKSLSATFLIKRS